MTAAAGNSGGPGVKEAAGQGERSEGGMGTGTQDGGEEASRKRTSASRIEWDMRLSH